MKTNFLIYKEHYDAFKVLNLEQKGLLFEALCQYAFEGKEPTNAEPVIIMGFAFVKNQIDRDFAKYEETVKRNQANGQKGGRPKKQDIDNGLKSNTSETDENPQKPTGLFGLSEKTQKTRLRNKELGIMNNDLGIKNNDNLEKEQKTKFLAPTLNEIQNFVSENKLSFIDPDAFFNYYTSNGWNVGKNKMKDWQSAVKAWNARNKTNKKPYQHPANELFNSDYNEQLLKF